MLRELAKERQELREDNPRPMNKQQLLASAGVFLAGDDIFGG